MKHQLRSGLLLFLAAFLSAPVFSAPCPPEGDGGDIIANRQKNRTTAPASVTDMEIDQFLQSFVPDLKAPVARRQFDPEERSNVESHEQRGVALLGYLILARQSEKESANCHDRKRRGLELWIGKLPEHTWARSKVASANAVIATVTPRGQDAHLNWRLAELRKLARQGAKVRISGWAFYDAEHPELLGRNRVSLWQIHPVTNIQVWSNGAWKDF
jgi:hypothetical protein